jgi:predicted nucleic acid-binding protein
MSVADLERAVRAEERLLLDTSCLLAYLDGAERVSPLAAHVLDELVKEGRNPAVVSMVTVMEVLVRPARRGVGEAYNHVLDLLTRFPNLSLCAIDVFVAQEAASLRATHNLSAVDALIVASGLLSQVGQIVTNDESWHRKLQPISQRVRVCYVGAHL